MALPEFREWNYLKMWTNHPNKDEIVKKIKLKDKAKLTERDKTVLMFSSLEENYSSEKAVASVADNFIDDGSINLVLDGLPPTDRHMPKSYKVALNDYDRVYWINFLVACEGQTEFSTDEVFRPRSKAILANAINDLEAFVEFYSPPMIGDPLNVNEYKLLRSAGFFQHTERLFNPTDVELLEAVERTKEWVKINQADPEFKSVQINFCFAGHGHIDESGRCGVEFRNGFMKIEELAKSIFSVLPNIQACDNRHRFDLFLDCCYAGAIGLEFLLASKRFNAEKLLHNAAETIDDGVPLGGIGIGRMFCASMHDEKSMEYKKLPHGLFTFSFLNEFSAKPLSLEGIPNIGLRDVGWITKGRQHPFFISFLKGAHPQNEDFIIKFPSLRYVSHYSSETLRKKQSIHIPDDTITKEGLVVDDMKFFAAQLDMRRNLVKQVESQIMKNPMMSMEVTPEEYLKQELYWF